MIDLRQGHTLERLRELPDESVQCIVTSPPYWGLRAYGTDPQVWLNGHEPCETHQWDAVESRFAEHRNGLSGSTVEGGTKRYRENMRSTATDTCAVCGAWRGELGLEPTPELYVEHLTQIFRGARRVLRGDGTLWLNLGDSYAAVKAGRADTDSELRRGRTPAGEIIQRSAPPGLKPKDLIGIPWRVAFALQADGWYLRSEIIWHKPNPMPESVTDRPTKAHEQVFLLAKSRKYYYDADAIAEQGTGTIYDRTKRPPKRMEGTRYLVEGKGQTVTGASFGVGRETRNKRSVWTVTTHPFKEAHFATFPPKLIEPMILAGCPVGGVVLDPFNGSGTTGLVATQLGRDYIGIELKPEYVEMTKRRLAVVQAVAT